MKLLSAKFHGVCLGCGNRIPKGSQIAWVGKGQVYHAACYSSASSVPTESFVDDEDDPDSQAAVLASDRRLAQRGLTVIRFSSGAVMTQNSRGRCEDAPCCGCCS